MNKIVTLLIVVLLAISLTACSSATTTITSTETIPAEAALIGQESTSAISETTPGVSAEEVVEKNAATHDDPTDYSWDEVSVIEITMNGNSASSSDTGVIIDGSVITITKAGTYRLAGNLTDGQVIVDTQDKEVTRLLLAGVDITSTTSAPIYIVNAEKTIIILQENSQNFLKDGTNYIYDDSEI
jgi:hypothetical protein